MKGIKTEWTPEMLERVRKDFRHEYNEILADELGVSVRTLIRKARELGVRKSKKFMQQCQAEAVGTANYLRKKHGWGPPKGFKIPNSEKYRFKPGHHNSPETLKRIAAKNSATRKRQIAEERRRVELWLKPKTKLQVIRGAKMRYYLRKLGYRIEGRYSFTAYYDENTKRSRRCETSEKGKYFTFLPAPGYRATAI